MAVSYMNLIRAFVSQLRETQALGCCGGGCGGGVQTKTIISPTFCNFGDIITDSTVNWRWLYAIFSKKFANAICVANMGFGSAR